MTFWDERYGQAEFAYGEDPNDFLKAQSHRIPLGQVLCLAEGQGRNGVYLAGLGHQITAVDQSAVGLAKAQDLAQRQGVILDTQVADLAEFEIGFEGWDGIISIFAHVPPDLRARIHRQVVSGLKPGGVFILEAYTEAHLNLPGTGGPPPDQKHLLMSQAALERELEGLNLEIAQEIEREVNEGQYHQGHSAVVQILAIKPL